MVDGIRAAGNVVSFYNAIHVHLGGSRPAAAENISEPLSLRSIVRSIGMTSSSKSRMARLFF